MAKVMLFHWKKEEADARVEELRAWGHEVAWRGMWANKEVKVTSPRKFGPDVIVFDLSRMPVYSKGHAELTRTAKSTAHIPFVFVEGETEKVAALKKIYPGETFTDWKHLPKVLAKIKAGAPRAAPDLRGEPVRELWQKIGIAAGKRVAIADAPREFYAALGKVPEGFEFQEDRAGAELVLRFFDDWDLYQRDLAEIARQTKICPVWIFYRKGVLKMNALRELALGVGVVDYKICSVNQNWAGMLVTRPRVKDH